MIKTATEAAIIMATILGKSNNDKTELFLAKVNHFNTVYIFPIITFMVIPPKPKLPSG